MSPGPWVDADVTNPGQRPGLYINFEKEATALISGGLTGVVGIAGQAAWGPDEVIQKIINETELLNFYTKNETSPNDLAFMISQALKGGAKECLVHRMEGAGAVKSTLNLVDTPTPITVITLDGKYNGTRADSFTVTIAANAINTNRKDVTFKEGATTLVTYVTTIDNLAAGMMQALVDQINDDDANFWIKATFVDAGDEELQDIAATNLTGGNNGAAIIAADYTLAMDKFELEVFGVFVTDTQDAGILTSIGTWVKDDMRGIGKKILWVTGADIADGVTAATADAEALNHEGIVYVYPGVKYLDFLDVEQIARGSKIAARIAGMIASRSLTQSITFQDMPTLVDVETSLTNAQVKDLLDSGVVVIVPNGTSFKVERGINTLTVLGTTQSNDFKKIQIIRVLDGIENALVISAADNIIGKFLNNSEGQEAMLALMRDFLDGLAQQGAIGDNFTVVLDPQQASTGDVMFVLIGITPVDSIEFIYVTVTIS